MQLSYSIFLKDTILTLLTHSTDSILSHREFVAKGGNRLVAYNTPVRLYLSWAVYFRYASQEPFNHRVFLCWIHITLQEFWSSAERVSATS